MEFMGTLFIISAPSGGGKTSLVTALIEQLPRIKVSVSHTTRAPRQGEVHGKNYFFVDEMEFSKCKAEGVFLESATVFNHSYGTSKNWALEQLQAGVDVVLEIDWQGARHIKEQMACVSIFILPPSKETLRLRLQDRQQDSQNVIADRMAKASHEISHYSEYDYIIINDNFETALEELMAVIKAQRVRATIQTRRYATLLASLIGESC